MNGLILDLNQIAAKVELPDDFVAERMSFVEPFYAELSDAGAQSLRANAIRMLKVQYHFQQPGTRPSSENLAATLAREHILMLLVRSNQFLKDPNLTNFKGNTYAERKKTFDEQEHAYKEQDCVLFDTNPELWWQHRVKDSYEFNKYNDQLIKQSTHETSKTSGCIIPIVIILSVGCGATFCFLRYQIGI